MTRALALALPISLALGCVASRTPPTTEAPTLGASASSIPTPEYALPFHAARIVDVAMLPVGPGERWRMVSGDLDG